MRCPYSIRTSDRRQFRRCLRKWGFSSALRNNLKQKGGEQNINFWFGSAIHFALEDFHGYNRFGDPRRALKAYFNAFKPEERPVGAYEHVNLGVGMLTYYLFKYEKFNAHHGFEAVWLTPDYMPVAPGTFGASPAVEIQFNVDLGIQAYRSAHTQILQGEYTELLKEQTSTIYETIITDDGSVVDIPHLYLGDMEIEIFPIMYHGTMDKIVRDNQGRYWIVDYKTAKGADINKLDTDDQISAYLWAAAQLFPFPIYGFVYNQLTKESPAQPKRLRNGDLSVDKKQKITYSIFKQTLLDEYGSLQKTPNKYIEFLNVLADGETPEGDRFIRWDFVTRTPNQLRSTYRHIVAETREMLDGNKYLYPNPTRDCIWDCPARDVCLALDKDDIDMVTSILNENYEKAPLVQQEEQWRSRLVYPEVILPLGDESEFEEELVSLDIMQADGTMNLGTADTSSSGFMMLDYD